MTLEKYLYEYGKATDKAESMEKAIVDRGLEAWFDSMSYAEIESLLQDRLDMAFVVNLDAEELAELSEKEKGCTYIIETKTELVCFDDVYNILQNAEIVEKLQEILEEYAEEHMYDEDVPF